MQLWWIESIWLANWEIWMAGDKNHLGHAPGILLLLASGMTMAIVSSAVSAEIVRTPERAIAIADKACSDSWSHIAGGRWDVPRSSWHARLVRDHWKVWSGEDEMDPDLSIQVPVSGWVDPDTCALNFRNQ